MKNSFENEITDIMEKYLKQEKLTQNNIDFCHNVCDFYTKILKCVDLTHNLINICDDFDCSEFCNKHNKIKILSYEQNTQEQNTKVIPKQKYRKIVCDFYNSAIIMTFMYEMTENEKNVLAHNFYVDGHLIFQRNFDENDTKIIKLAYIKNLINNNNLKITLDMFLKIFFILLNIYHIYENTLDMCTEDSLSKHVQSDSDISSIENNEED